MSTKINEKLDNIPVLNIGKTSGLFNIIKSLKYA